MVYLMIVAVLWNAITSMRVDFLFRAWIEGRSFMRGKHAVCACSQAPHKSSKVTRVFRRLCGAYLDCQEFICIVRLPPCIPDLRGR